LKTLKIVTVVSWFVVVAVLAGFVIWVLTGTIFGFGSWRWGGFGLFGCSGAHSGHFEIVGTHSASPGGLNSISIDWVAGDVTLALHGDPDIEITEFAQRGLREDQKFHISQSGGTLHIRFTESPGLGTMPPKRLEVLVPEEFGRNLGWLTVESVSGGVELLDVGTGTLNVKTVSGAIHLSSVDAQALDVGSTSGSVRFSLVHAENMTVGSTSGAISIEDSSAMTLSCANTSGSISIDGTFEDVSLRSVSGSISLNNSADSSIVGADSASGRMDLSGSFDKVEAQNLSGRISISSQLVPSSLVAGNTSGSITVSMPDEGAVTVRHSSASGSFSSEIPVTMQDQRGAQFEFSTVSGDTEILRLH